MKKIFKEILEMKDSNTKELPLGTQILSVEAQGSNIAVYTLADIEQKEKVVYDFRIYGTWRDIGFDLNGYEFLDSIKLNNGHLTGHIFYKIITK